MQILRREFKYDDNGRPVMILRKKQYGRAFSSMPRAVSSYAIRLEDVWQFSQDHNPNFITHMGNVCTFLCDLFSLGLITPRKMAEIATVIEEGIDDLVKMPPQATKQVCTGEIKMTQRSLAGDGEVSVTSDMVEEMPLSETIH